MTEHSHTRICRILSVNSVFSLALSFVAAFSSGGSIRTCTVLTLSCFLLLLLGYFTQALSAKLFKFNRRNEAHGYESSIRYYSFVKSLPVFIVTLIISFFVFILSYNSSPGQSLIPYLLTALVAITVTIGSSVWFYPNHRLVSLKTLLTSVPLFCMVFALTAFNSGSGFLIPSVCLALHAVSTLIVLNQTNMTKSYIGTVTSFASLRDKQYNIGLVMMSLIFAGAAALLIYTALNGLRVLLLFLIFLIFKDHITLPGSDAPISEREPREISEQLSRLLYGTKAPSQSVNFYFFIVFLVISIAFFLFLFIRRLGSGARLVAALKAFVDRVISFFSRLFIKDRPIASSTVVVNNYFDIEQRVDAVSDEIPGAPVDEFRQFTERLQSITDDNKRLKYAYSTFVKSLNRISVRVKKSNTPREIERLLKKETMVSNPLLSEEDIKCITRAFETAAYSRNTPGKDECQKAIEQITIAIRRIMN